MLVPMLVEQAGQLVRLLLPAAEHQPGDGDPELPVFPQLVDDIAHALLGGELPDLVFELFRLLRVEPL